MKKLKIIIGCMMVLVFLAFIIANILYFNPSGARKHALEAVAGNFDLVAVVEPTKTVRRPSAVDLACVLPWWSKYVWWSTCGIRGKTYFFNIKENYSDKHKGLEEFGYYSGRNKYARMYHTGKEYVFFIRDLNKSKISPDDRGRILPPNKKEPDLLVLSNPNLRGFVIPSH